MNKWIFYKFIIISTKHAITKENYVKGYMWYTLSREYSKRRKLAKKMNPIQIALAKKLAAECVAKKYKGC